MRPDVTNNLDFSPLASAVVDKEVPLEPQGKTVNVVFDERPIRIVGTSKFEDDELRLHAVTCAGGDRPIRFLLPQTRALARGDGSFVLEGVPPGNVRFGWIFAKNGLGDERLQTRPGVTYTVRISDSGLELLSSAPSEESSRTKKE